MIDPFTVVAQIVNFLILIGLLRYFLYDRILQAMDARQKELADKWEEAERQRQQAAQELSDAEAKSRELTSQREQWLAEAQQEVEQYRHQLTGSVRSEVNELRQRWTDALREETDAFLHDLRIRAGQQVCAIAGNALRDLADVKLERQVVDHFLQKLDTLDEEARAEIIDSLDKGQRAAIVQTSYPLDEESQQAIAARLRGRLFDDMTIRFEQSDDLVCGIALHTNSHKLAWDLRDYLVDLERELQKTLEEETGDPGGGGDAAAVPEVSQ